MKEVSKISQLRKETLDEAYFSLKKNDYNGIVILPTGTGKSSILIQALKDIKPKKCWYLCDSRKNRDVTFKEELKKWGADKYIKKIKFMCYQTACKIEDEQLDLILADEADFAITDVYILSLLNNKAKYKVLVSATLSEDKRKIAQKIAPIIYEKGLEDIEGKGVINEGKFHLVKYMLSKEENFKYLSYNNIFAKLMNEKPRNKFKLKQAQINRKHFLSGLDSAKRVCRSLLKELAEDKNNKVLVFCGLSEQADAICKYSFHTQNGKVGERNFKDFDEGLIRFLAVCGKVDRGININGVNNIISESPGKSNTKFQQKTGRGRRLKIGEILNMYFLIPYYKDRYGKIKPTIVESWFFQSLGKLEIKPIIHNLKYKTN